MTEEKKQEKTRFEEFRLEGGEILNKVKEIIHEGNVRKIFRNILFTTMQQVLVSQCRLNMSVGQLQEE